MVTLRTCVAVLLVSGVTGAAGCSSPPQTETPAVVASTPTSLETDSFVINPQFDLAFSFSEGLASVEIGDEWGFIDKTGSVVINPQFGFASPFSEGLAAVRIGDDMSGTWGFIAR